MNRSTLFLVIFLGLLSLPCFAETPQHRLKGHRPLPAMPEGAFTFVVIPDTQSYLGKGTKKTPASQDQVSNPYLKMQVDWILSHLKDQNIVFVSHVGDIVDKNTPEQWLVAKQHLQRLHDRVPFSLSVGNHDMTSKGDARFFQQHFPAKDFADYPWYIGSFDQSLNQGSNDGHVHVNNVNSAQRFNVGGIPFIHLSLECNAPDEVLTWAHKVLNEHADHQAIITTHMDLGIIEKPKDHHGHIHDPKGRMRWSKIHGSRGNHAEQMWEKLYSKQAPLNLILCGDQSRVTALRLTREGSHGQNITSLLSDYQSLPVLRLMRFKPSHHEMEVDVLTYDVEKEVLVEGTQYVPSPEQHQFKLTFPIKAAANR